MEDIIQYARSRVDNKGVLQRIGHSPKLHKFRSAISSKGSFGSKGVALVTLGVRTALKKIPIPVIGGLLARIEQTVEDAKRQARHQKRSRTAVDIGTKVKFDLKELSVDSMDRYRWKVDESLKSLNKAADSFKMNFQKKQADNAQCDAYLDYAMAYAQACRRVEKLEEQCAGLEAAVQITNDWLQEIKEGKDGTGKTEGLSYMGSQLDKLVKDDIDDELKTADTKSRTGGEEAAENWILEHHGNCDQWCCFRERGVSDKYATLKNRAAKVTNFLLNNYGESDLIGDVVSCVTYKGQKQDKHNK